MDNIVYIIAIHSDDRAKTQKYEHCINSWKQWCSKNNASVFVLDQPLYDYEYLKPNFFKYYVFQLLDNSGIDYNKVLYVDADTIVHPECPNFFETDNKDIQVVVNQGSLDWVHRSIEIYGKFLYPEIHINYWEYFNSGFMLFDRSHKEFLDQVIDHILQNRDELVRIERQYGIGNDQTMFNFLCRKFEKDLTFLPTGYNLQDIQRFEGLNNFAFENFAKVAHFNCWPQPNPGHWMEQTYNRWWKT